MNKVNNQQALEAISTLAEFTQAIADATLQCAQLSEVSKLKDTIEHTAMIGGNMHLMYSEALKVVAPSFTEFNRDQAPVELGVFLVQSKEQLTQTMRRVLDKTVASIQQLLTVENTTRDGTITLPIITACMDTVSPLHKHLEVLIGGNVRSNDLMDKVQLFLDTVSSDNIKLETLCSQQHPIEDYTTCDVAIKDAISLQHPFDITEALKTCSTLVDKLQEEVNQLTTGNHIELVEDFDILHNSIVFCNVLVWRVATLLKTKQMLINLNKGIIQ